MHTVTKGNRLCRSYSCADPGSLGPIPFQSDSLGLGSFGPILGMRRWSVVSAHFILYRFLSGNSFSC